MPSKKVVKDDKSKPKFKFIDLFAGLGGFHLALSSLGGQCVFASEIKEDLRELYKINFPGTPIFGDITKIKPEDIPPHDMICGGFPCQPFSQAGKRQGFNDENGRGNLFYYIRDIISYHKPRYILLENVQNLEGHDNGNTWKTIETTLRGLGYDVAKKILSPHQFGIPQHRKRIYIVGISLAYGDLKDFRYPEPTGVECNINSIIDEKDTNVMKLKTEVREKLNVWQEFIDKTIANGDKIPQFPIWAMEFGATYNYKDIAPAHQKITDLLGKRGHLGKKITGKTLKDCVMQLPNYAQTSKELKFPHWKIRYIEENRAFYERNKNWLDDWKKQLKDFDNSYMKMEWNCGYETTFSLEDKIIQFRASGIRVKFPTFSPALNLCGTQIPVFPWVKLPHEILKRGEPNKGRYMTLKEAAKIQGMQKLKFNVGKKGLTLNRTYEALGNAVNVDVMKMVAQRLLEV